MLRPSLAGDKGAGDAVCSCGATAAALAGALDDCRIPLSCLAWTDGILRWSGLLFTDRDLVPGAGLKT